MDMDKILEMLGVQKLDESAQAEIKTKLQDIIEIKAKEMSESTINEEKERLITEYEEKFEEYKNDITSKFSNFVDSILDEELEIPEKIMEYAHKGELYSEIIEQLKVRLAIDEGVLDEEVKNLLREARDEIANLKEELNEKISSEMELREDAEKMASALYIRKKCDGLTESQKSKVVSVLEGITDKDEIDRKFDIIVENINTNDDVVEEEVEGSGVTEVINEDNQKVEEGPFDQYMKEYINILKSKKL